MIRLITFDVPNIEVQKNTFELRYKIAVDDIKFDDPFTVSIFLFSSFSKRRLKPRASASM